MFVFCFVMGDLACLKTEEPLGRRECTEQNRTVEEMKICDYFQKKVVRRNGLIY